MGGDAAPDLGGKVVVTPSSVGTKYHDPFGFGYAPDGVTRLGTVPIPGAGSIFGGLYRTTHAFSASTGFGRVGAQPTVSGIPLSPDQLMQVFLGHTVNNTPGATPDQVAAIQSQMYRAGGYYSKNFVPDYGHIRDQDKKAFRDFLRAFALDPNPNGIGTELTQQALNGDKAGTNLRQRTPLVVSISNPDDIRAVLHKTALDLYGGDLNEEQTQSFINTFQAEERNYQTQHYALTGVNPVSGQTDQGFTGPPAGAAGELTKPPTSAGLGLEAEQAIRQAHPEQVFVSGLGKTLGAMLPGLLGPGAGMLGG